MDAIPDFIPGVGYTDDLGVLMAAMGSVMAHIDDSSRKWAKDRLRDRFGADAIASLGGDDLLKRGKQNTGLTRRCFWAGRIRTKRRN